MRSAAQPFFESMAELLFFYSGADEAIFKSHCLLGESEIAGACREGRSSASGLRLRHDSRNAVDIAVSYGCAIANESWQVADGRVIYLGEGSSRPPLIRINKAAVGSLAALMTSCGGENNWESCSESRITEVVIAHELFHLMERSSPSIAGELRAHAFARALTGLPFSPLLFDTLLRGVTTGKNGLP